MQTEKEKMLSGLPYKASDNELVAERLHAKILTHELNNLHPADLKKRNELIISLFGKTGTAFTIESAFHCDYGYNISIGENFYANYNCVILDCAKVTFGDNVFIAPNVGIYTAGHPLHHEPRNEEFEYAFPITIGSNVWIGGNVVINPNITIGDNVVIGSGSVVTKNIPSNVVAVGNPCRVLRTITEDDKLYYYRKMKL